MTREEVEKIIKPIEWKYTHERATYYTSMEFFNRRIEIYIEDPLPNAVSKRVRIESSIGDLKLSSIEFYENLDEAMKKARLHLVEVCGLFDLDKE